MSGMFCWEELQEVGDVSDNRGLGVSKLGCPPAQDAISSLKYFHFRLGDPDLNLHLPLESWEGGTTQVIRRNVFSLMWYGEFQGT